MQQRLVLLSAGTLAQVLRKAHTGLLAFFFSSKAVVLVPRPSASSHGVLSASSATTEDTSAVMGGRISSVGDRR